MAGLFIMTLLGIASSCAPPSFGPPAERLTMTEIPIPAADDSSGPRLAGGNGLPVVLSWLEPTDAGTRLRFAILEPDGWGTVQTITESPELLQNWADFPSVVPIDRSRWAAHWLVKNPAGPYAYDVAATQSSDAGASWSTPVTPHDDNTPTEHGFVSIYPTALGDETGSAAPGLIWLDGRNMAENGSTALRAATLDLDVGVVDPQLIDPLVCDCCATDVAVTAAGPIAVYRNRTEAEIRDIYLSRMIDGVWQPGQAVADDGWHITGCPVNGPAVAAQGERVAVGWYTAAENSPRVRVALSHDSGSTFDPAIDIATGPIMGRIGIVMLADGAALVSWIQNKRIESGTVIAEIRVRRVSGSRQANLGPSRLVAQTGAGRPAGFPQILRNDKQLVFAWIDSRAEPSQLRTGLVDVRAL